MLIALKQKKEALIKKFYRFFSPEEVIRIGQSITTALFALTMSPMLTIASAEGINVENMFGMLIGTICQIFFYIGAILFAWSIGQLVMAFKNEDADSKSRAIMVLVCSLLLMSVKKIYNKVSAGTGITAGDGAL